MACSSRGRVRGRAEHYYELAGWDKGTGMPTQSKLEELGLGWAA